MFSKQLLDGLEVCHFPAYKTTLTMSRSALYLANQMVASGAVECAMALGFEKMQPGSLKGNFTDRTPPLDKTTSMMAETRGITTGPFAAQIFGNGAAEYVERYGATWEDVAAIAAKVRCVTCTQIMLTPSTESHALGKQSILAVPQCNDD